MKEGITKSKRFQLFAVSFLLSVAVFSIYDGNISSILLLSVMVVGWILIIVRTGALFTYIGVILIIICFGALRVVWFQTQIPIQDLQKTFEAQIVAEPDVRQDGVRYIVSSEQGRFYIKSQLYPRYAYGETLSIKCSDFAFPEPIENFRYDKYLQRLRVHHVCQYPVILDSKKTKGNFFLYSIYSFKEIVAVRVGELWHEPYAAFMAGLLYGYRGGLGSLNHDFAQTGVTHIVAISGYNITVLVSIVQPLLLSLGIGRKHGFYIVIVFIIAFTIFAGLSASVVRAAIMGSIVLFARHLGRASSMANTLILSALLMTLHNPYVLIWDAGFQLSFISTVGLIYLNPLFDKMAKFLPEVLSIRESAQTTCSATIITLPLILYQFKRMSVVAIPTNLLVLWIIPFIMFSGFATLIISLFFMQLAWVSAWLSWAMMHYIIVVVRWLAKLSFASYDASLSFPLMCLSYTLLIYVMYWYHKQQFKQYTV